VIIGATTVLVAALGATFAATPANAATGCKVAYTANEWPGGFSASITVDNLGDALTSWKLEFDYPDASQKISQGWNGRATQSGQHVTITNEAWNGNLATGASVTPGLNGSWSGSNPAPTSFTLNGAVCTGSAGGENQAPSVAITTPANGASFTAPASIPIRATATDPDQGDSISVVEFYRDGILVGSANSAPYQYTLTAVPVGEYTLQAKAYDSSGAEGLSEEVSVSVTDPGPQTPQILVSAASLRVTAGDTATFDVRLSEAPSANTTVTVARTAGNTGVSVSSGSRLTFTPSNWSTQQTVTVAASSEAEADSATLTASATDYTSALITVIVGSGNTGDYAEEFMELYNKIKAPANGYFSPEGVPYHSIETLMVEAPDHGHETTSEAFSYYLWLEAQYGRATENWAPFNKAWDVMEKYIIPSGKDYPSTSGYDASKPATYAPEYEQPDKYPTTMDSGATAGKDPLYAELKSTYGTNDIYGMHWLLDVDNTYGFGKCGDGTTKVAYINTFQRGPQESVWETVPQPSCDTFKHGNSSSGYLSLFIKDSQYSKQWKFTNAPDADARAVQAAYWALTWAKEQGKSSAVSATIAKAAKMGDYLRYAMYDKYFKKPGCTSPTCAAGTGKDSAAYLMNWYYAWGGAIDGSWSWRIGSSYNHQGYQNPFAAWALSTVSELTPKSSTAKTDWATSLKRQIEFYTWLQSDEGAIAGGATNSWEGAYKTPPSGTPTFYGMAYDVDPVYHDPPSNQWFGMQAWGMERMAEYYYASGDTKAEAILDKWVKWAISETTVGNGDFRIPSDLTWTGKPGGNWQSGTSSVNNSGLHVSVKNYSQDIGVAGAYARLLTYYAAKSGDEAAKATAKGLLDGILANKDDLGISVTEERKDYNRFDDKYASGSTTGVFIPSDYTGTMPNGDQIKSGATFLGLRSWYMDDPNWDKVQSYLDGGPVPTFNYHRFWAQVDIALALGDYARLIDGQ
jgi:hypothetical protein